MTSAAKRSLGLVICTIIAFGIYAVSPIGANAAAPGNAGTSNPVPSRAATQAATPEAYAAYLQKVRELQSKYGEGRVAEGAYGASYLEVRCVKMKTISDGMEASTAEVEAAIRADFEGLPDFAKKELLDMLGAPGTPEREWWEGVLLSIGELPDAMPAQP